MNYRQKKKMKRKYGCEYCTKYKSMYWGESREEAIKEIYVEGDGSLTVSSRFGDKYDVNIPIDYCPMCGRDVSKEH